MENLISAKDSNQYKPTTPPPEKLTAHPIFTPSSWLLLFSVDKNNSLYYQACFDRSQKGTPPGNNPSNFTLASSQEKNIYQTHHFPRRSDVR